MHSAKHSATSSTSNNLMMHVSADQKKKQLENIEAQRQFQEKLATMRKANGVTNQHIDDVKQAEIIRKSVNHVQDRAEEQRRMRTSPSRYNQVRSKVAGNLESQKRSKQLMDNEPNIHLSENSDMPQDNFYAEYWQKTQMSNSSRGTDIVNDTRSSGRAANQTNQNDSQVNQSSDNYAPNRLQQNQYPSQAARMNDSAQSSQKNQKSNQAVRFSGNNSNTQYKNQQLSQSVRVNANVQSNNYQNQQVNQAARANGTVNGSAGQYQGQQMNQGSRMSGNGQNAQYQNQQMNQSAKTGQNNQNIIHYQNQIISQAQKMNGNNPNDAARVNGQNQNQYQYSMQRNQNDNQGLNQQDQQLNGDHDQNGDLMTNDQFLHNRQNPNRLSTVPSEANYQSNPYTEYDHNLQNQQQHQLLTYQEDQDQAPLRQSNKLENNGSTPQRQSALQNEDLQNNGFQSDYQDNMMRSSTLNNNGYYKASSQQNQLSQQDQDKLEAQHHAQEDNFAQFQQHMEEHPELVDVFQSAARAITKLNQKSFQDLKILAKPPQRVKMALEPLAIFMGCKDTEWSTIQKLLSDPHIFQNMQNFDYDNIQVKTLRKVEKYILMPEYNLEAITKSSKPAGVIAQWIIATFEIGMIKNQLQLKNRPELEQKRAELQLQEMQRQEEAMRKSKQPKKLPPPPVRIQRNMEIYEATAQVQKEFDRVNTEKREQDPNIKGFYGVINEFYNKDNNERHASPVKRLVGQKNAKFDHGHVFKNNYVQEQDYKLEYTTSPTKSYVIEPKDGPIDYSLATKDPLKFYDNVINSDVTQHKVTMNKDHVEQVRKQFAESIKNGTQPPKNVRVPLEMTSKQTKRKVGTTVRMVMTHLNEILMDRLADNEHANKQMVDQALKDTQVQKQIQQAVKGNQIMLVDSKDQKPMMQTEMQLMGQQSAHVNIKDMANTSQNHDLDQDQHQNASLVVDDDALNKVQKEVVKYIRRNSTMHGPHDN